MNPLFDHVLLCYAENLGGIGQLPHDGIDGTSGAGNEFTRAGVTSGASALSAFAASAGTAVETQQYDLQMRLTDVLIASLQYDKAIRLMKR